MMKNKMKKFYIRTYGCQMNENDTEVMCGMLERRGLERCESEDDADLLLFNTCSIRDLAERKVMGKLGKLGRKRNKKRIIGITGCMANAKKESLFKKLPHIDFVLGTNNIHELNTVLDEVIKQWLSESERHNDRHNGKDTDRCGFNSMLAIVLCGYIQCSIWQGGARTMRAN